MRARLSAALLFIFVSSAHAQTILSLDQWSGLILQCQVDPKLDMPKDMCDQIYAEAAKQAAAAKIKFVALNAGEGKVEKAKAAGIDDSKAIEMVIHIRTTTGTRPAAVDMDALSRLHPVPVAVAGKPDVYRKIYTQGGDYDPIPNWPKQTMPMVKAMLQGFFQTYMPPAK